MMVNATVTTFRRKDGSWWGRVRIVNPEGKPTVHTLSGRNKTNARQRAEEKLKDIQSITGVPPQTSATQSPITFNKFGDIFEAEYLQPPKFDRAGTKISGLYSYKQYRSCVKRLRRHFGEMPLWSITFADLKAYRALLFDTPTHIKVSGGIRSIADVNLAFATLKRMFTVAVQDDFVTQSPFAKDRDKILIDPDGANRRHRVLSFEEEDRLLEACEYRSQYGCSPSAHLMRPLVIAAIDTCARLTELKRITWGNVNFDDHIITVTSNKGRRTKARPVPMGERVEAELIQLRVTQSSKLDDKVFPLPHETAGIFRRLFDRAKIYDFIFHDLRHTGGTRLSRGGLPVAEISRILGHSNLKTTLIYLNLTEEGLDDARAIINARNLARKENKKEK